MKSFIVKLTEKREIARETMEFVFEKPEMKYEAGQYVLVTLIDPKYTDIKGNTRAMSIASAPSEDFVSIAMRMSDSAFKRSLKEMELGTELEIQGPLGHLTIPYEEERHIVFLAGGIGVVPFRAMMVENINSNWNKKMSLIHSNRIPEDISYYKEFEELKKHQNLSVVNTVSNKGEYPGWTEEKGRIDKSMILKNIPDALSCKFYIVGIPAMVQAMQNILIEEIGMPAESVQVELFGGY